MSKELKMKYSILPSRIINEKRFKIAHYNVMVCMGCHAGKSGLVYMTVETIEHECPHVKRETIKNAIKDLIAWGYLYKLESKYIKNQKSRWLTNRYMLVYTKDQPIPPYEELEKEVINLSRADDTVKKEIEVKEDTYNEQECLNNLHMMKEAVNSVAGYDPQYTLPEYIQVMGDSQLDMTRQEVSDFTRNFMKRYHRAPSLKEVCYHAKLI